MTFVYQIDSGCKRLLGVIKGLRSFFQEFEVAYQEILRSTKETVKSLEQ